MPKICLDDGHNSYGADTGAQGNGLREQDLTLDIVRRIKPLLEFNGFEVTLTRDGDFVNGPHDTVMQSLQTRCSIANQFGADLFVSVHINSGGGTGSEVYALPGGHGIIAAQRVLERLISACGWANRGLKTDKEFYVLVNTDMPAILTENGFIDTAVDAAKLTDPNFRLAIAEAHARGICDYFGVEYKGEEVEGFMDLILVGRGPDERAAGYLADYLNAPVAYMDAVKQVDIDSARNVYQVGGAKQFNKAILIAGTDRYATAQAVLDFIKDGGK